MQDETTLQKTTHQPLDWVEGDMPYSTLFGDQFYCKSDGRQECEHVFLKGNELPERWLREAPFVIGELGFGTGLNFCETWRQWQLTRLAVGHLTFVSFELYPMRASEIDRALLRWSEIADERQALVSAWPDDPQGHVSIDLDSQTRLIVVCGPAGASVAASAHPFDAWYLDGFAPSRNPDLWSEDMMQAVFDQTVPGGRFATYAAAGFVRRNLQGAGFTVEKRPGFAGKREMLCGVRPQGTSS